MDVTQIPFNKFIAISHSSAAECALELAFTDRIRNHLGTLHASAQFALAEACSGLALQRHFPHLADAVVPVLRKSEVKFKRPAQSTLRARAQVDAASREAFESQLNRKGRATIVVPVELTDQEGTITLTGTYEWYVQKTDG